MSDSTTFEGDRKGLDILRQLQKRLSPRAVAIVGSRQPDHLGHTWSTEIAKVAVHSNLIVISGGAIGIDTSAHLSALQYGGSTVAILGCGMEQLSRRLLNLSSRGVGHLSPFPKTQPSKPWTFPKRNVDIAILSDLVIVVQATEQSGSLYTARKALSLNKKVFVLTHQPQHPKHKGCLQLLREGAQPLLSFYSWLEDLSLESHIPLSSTTIAQQDILPHPSPLWKASSEQAKSIEMLANESFKSYSDALLEIMQLELEGWLIPVVGVGYRRGYGNGKVSVAVAPP